METILFLIIVGILSTIFGKGKSNRTPSVKKPFSKNRMEDIRTIFKELTNNEPSKTSPIKAEQKTESLKNNLKDLEKEYLQVRQVSEASRIGMATSRQLADKTNQPIKRKQEENETVILENPDVNTLVNGFIWSEILGEPRSKRPYMAKRR